MNNIKYQVIETGLLIVTYDSTYTINSIHTEMYSLYKNYEFIEQDSDWWRECMTRTAKSSLLLKSIYEIRII